MNVPHKEGDTLLGEIVVQIEPDGTVLVPKAALIQHLAPLLDKAALARLESVPDRNGQVALGDLGGASFRLTYDPNQIELIFNPAVEQRALSDLSLGTSVPGWRQSGEARGPLGVSQCDWGGRSSLG